jgi:2-oxoglutarate ferredoxin oxidoreductase subunit alpha
MAQLKERGIRAKYLQMRTLWPFPVEKVEQFIAGCREVFVVENNYSGQLSSLIRSQVSSTLKMRNILKYSSQSFRPIEISTQVQKAL